MDLSQRRELNNGAGESLARAFELAVTPTIFAAIGWAVDSRLGTFPLFSLVCFLGVFVYLCWKQYGSYNATMKAEEQKLLGRRDQPGSGRVQ